MNDIHTTGYPRSGNNWTSEFLSDLLSSPVIRGDKPVWFGGHHGKYTLHFNHATVNELKVPGPIIFIYRDPRAVAVSKMFYTHSTSLIDTIETMERAPQELPKGTIREPYSSFVSGWWTSTNPQVVRIQYETLYANPDAAVKPLLDLLGIPFNQKWISKVATRHTFEATYRFKCKEYNCPIGTKIHALRCGKPDDWLNHYTQEAGQLSERYHGELMRLQGYTTTADWWKQLPIKV